MPREAKVVRLDGPVILDWGNGMRMQLSPAGVRSSAGPPAKQAAGGRPGRKPSPATQALIDAMEADRSAGKRRDRDVYKGILQSAGYDGSEAGANQILAREAKRVFGETLGRATKSAPKKAAKKGARRGGKKAAKRGAKKAAGAGPGRRPSQPTILARQRIQADAGNGTLKEAPHYVRWLVQQPGLNIGLKGARPIVYRELRKAKEQ